VGITTRAQVTGTPRRLSVAGGVRREIVGWAGPWPLAGDRRRPGPQRARLQLVLAGEGDEPPEAVLVHCAGTENPLWTVEGVYD
jgi:protein ImuB